MGLDLKSVQQPPKPSALRPYMSVPKRLQLLHDEFLQQVEYLKCSVANSSIDRKKQLSENITNKFVESFRTVQVPFAMASSISKMISEDLFTKEQQDAMQQVLDSSVTGKAEQQPPRTKQPQHDWLENYFTKSEWELMTSKTHDFTAKVRCIAQRCIAIRLKHISENSARRLGAIAILADHAGPPSALKFCPATALGIVRDVKVMLRLEWKHVRFEPFLTEAYPRNPQDVNSTLYQVAYMDEPPVDYPLDKVALDHLISRIPARKTHSSVSASIGSSGGATSEAMQLIASVLSMMQPGSPRIQMLRPGASRGERLTRAIENSGNLALPMPEEDSPATPQASNNPSPPAPLLMLTGGAEIEKKNFEEQQLVKIDPPENVEKP